MKISYVVAKPFKYGGRLLQPGDPFPGGGKYDTFLISQRWVLAQELDEAEQPKPRRTRSKTL